MLLAQGHDEPAVVKIIVLLSESARDRDMLAAFGRARCGQRLLAQVLPVLQPAAAAAGLVAHVVDVFDPHRTLLKVWSHVTRDTYLRHLMPPVRM